MTGPYFSEFIPCLAHFRSQCYAEKQCQTADQVVSHNLLVNLFYVVIFFSHGSVNSSNLHGDIIKWGKFAVGQHRSMVNIGTKDLFFLKKTS